MNRPRAPAARCAAARKAFDEGPWPQMSPEERADPAFEEGVSCAHCIDRLTEEKAASLRERQRQIMRETGRG